MTSSSKENVAFQLFNLKKLELKFARVRVFCLFLLPCKCILKEFSAFVFSSPFPASSLLFFFSNWHFNCLSCHFQVGKFILSRCITMLLLDKDNGTHTVLICVCIFSLVSHLCLSSAFSPDPFSLSVTHAHQQN